ncbi:MAG: hypothetical protein R3Y24_13840 [Eubacteriales bacterium]
MKCNIFDSEYEILEEESPTLALMDSSGTRVGLCDYFDKKIWIKKDINEQEKKKTLLHELTHAFLYETQLSAKEKYSLEEVCECVGRFGMKMFEIVEEYFKSE